MTALPDEPPRPGETRRPPPPVAYQRPLNVRRLWAGGVATAVVAALIALVGVLVVRTMMRVSGMDTGTYSPGGSVLALCVIAALAALAATGLAHLLVTTTPRPLTYLSWIVGLATAVAVVWPLVTGDSMSTGLAHSVVYLVIGMTISSLLITTVRASRPYMPVPPAR